MHQQKLRNIKNKGKKRPLSNTYTHLSKFNNKYDKMKNTKMHRDNMKLFNTIRNIKMKKGRLNGSKIHGESFTPLESNSGFHKSKYKKKLIKEN